MIYLLILMNCPKWLVSLMKMKFYCYSNMKHSAGVLYLHPVKIKTATN